MHSILKNPTQSRLAPQDPTSMTNSPAKHSPLRNEPSRLSREAAEIAVPLGIAAMAAIATFSRAPQKVLSTMWISFAIVGTAAVIALSRQEEDLL